MTTVFNIKVNSIHAEDQSGLNGVVHQVEFSVVAEDSGQRFLLSQKVNLPDHDIAKFIPLHELAEADVVAWVESSCKEEIQMMRERLQRLIDQATQHPSPLLPWVSISPEEQAAKMADAVRAQRNTLLADSDWTQVADAPVNKQAWADYRQSMRDITKQAGFPSDVHWPTQPN